MAKGVVSIKKVMGVRKHYDAEAKREETEAKKKPYTLEEALLTAKAKTFKKASAYIHEKLHA